MNWLKIKEQAEIYKGKSVIYPKRWFNEAKHELANLYMTACKFSDTTIIAVEGTKDYTLPGNTKYVKKVRDENDNPVYLYSVDIPELVIRFPYSGTYVVTCAFEADDVIGNDSEEPQINSAYHYAMSKYIAAKELEYIRPEKSQELLAQYYSEADKANKSLSRGRAGRLILPGRRSY